MTELYRISLYVPSEAKERVKSALFQAGAGRIGNYDSCCWQTKGTGQFRPLQGSNPAIGSTGTIEQVEEYKLELVCEKSRLKTAIKAMKEAHPYEEPAYEFYPINTF